MKSLPKSNQFVRVFALITFSLFLSNCSFNKQILAHEKVSPSVKELIYSTPEDTFIIPSPYSSHQIVFTKNGNDTVELGYTIENVFFKNADGHMLNGWFLKPKMKTPLITLLHLHGNEGYILTHYKYISPLVKHGYQIFMVDYSGFGFSEGVITRENIISDAVSALAYLKSRPDVNGTTLAIYGQSLGAHYSTVVGPLVQNDIDGMIIESPITSFKGIAAYKIPVIGGIIMKQGYYAHKSIQGFHKPLLVIHSNEDKDAPFKMGKRIYDNANQPKEFFEIRNCHCCGPIYYSNEISDRIKNMVGLKS